MATESRPLELGLDTFGDVTAGPDGAPLPHAEVLRNLVAEAELADSLGVDFIGIGEHHRSDFAVSAPEIVMAAIAARTTRIRIGTAVTVLSSDDPVRLYQRLATLDALSNGRAELIVGRGSFTESFPLFGFELRDYDDLFEEKLDLFVSLLRNETVSWRGKTRTGLQNATVYPRMESAEPTVWVGVGGSPESVVRAVHHDLPMMLAIIGGNPARFKPYAELYRRAQGEMKRRARPLGVHSPGHVGATDAEAKDAYWPGYKAMHDRIGAERGWPPMSRDAFEAEIAHGSLYVGGPETVARKIASTVQTLQLDRFDLKYSAGPQQPKELMENIRLYGEKVIPMVRDMLATDRVGTATLA